jgi:hypothetical protein
MSAIQAEVYETMKSDVVLLKWMVGFILAFQVAIVLKLFLR